MRKMLSDFFTCSICTMVVKEPVECAACEILLCKQCFDKWKLNNGNCPKECKGFDKAEFKAAAKYVSLEL